MIFGYQAEEIVGKSIKTLIATEHHPEEDARRRVCRRAGDVATEATQHSEP
jgi:PAS domain S-box-containing protein